MSQIQIINASSVEQNVDAIVNAANNRLLSGGGVCGAIFKKAGAIKLTMACAKHKTPLADGEAVVTPAFDITNAQIIIHAVGPNFGKTPDAFDALYRAYEQSLVRLMENNYHSIAFPLISAGIYGGALPHPAMTSTEMCCRAYKQFVADHPNYDIEVLLCAYSSKEMQEAQAAFEGMMT